MNFDRYFFYFFWAIDHLSQLPKDKQIFALQRARLHRRLTNQNPKRNVFRPVEERHVSFLSKTDMDRLPTDRPLVFRGLANQSSVMKKWDFDYFKNRYNNTTQPFYKNIDGRIEMDFFSVKEGLEKIIQEKPSHSYLGGPYDLLNVDHSLRADLELEKIIDQNFFKNKFTLLYKLFFAGKGQSALVHSEFGAVLNILAKGKKRWLLFRPEDSPLLKPDVSRTIFLRSELYSKASILRNQDFGIEAWEVSVEEGDILYFPSYFWHYVENEDNAISVEFKWGSIQMLFRNFFLTAILLTARNPSLLGQFARIRNPSIKPSPDIFNN